MRRWPGRAGPTLCRWAEEIERLGFAVVLDRDHVLWHSPVLDPLTALAACAGRTTRIRLSTGVLLLPLRHPTLVVKAVASLDYFSHGRAILCIGLGGEFPQEYAACGVPLRARGRRANEAIRAITALWTESPATFTGTFSRCEKVVMEPRPLQHPDPPIWVGGRSEAARALAGTPGDGWLAYFVTPERFRTSLDQALAHQHHSGLSPPSFTAGLVLYFCRAPSDEAARRTAAHYLATEYHQPFAHGVEQYCALGSVSDCVATIARFVEAGSRHINLIPIGPPAVVLEQLGQLSAALFPCFRPEGREEGNARVSEHRGSPRCLFFWGAVLDRAHTRGLWPEPDRRSLLTGASLPTLLAHLAPLCCCSGSTSSPPPRFPR